MSGLEIDISMSTERKRYGVGDASYQAAGEEAGIRQLVDDFYVHMDSLPQAQRIRQMHPDDLAESRDKLTRFLCGWMGGPKLYQAKYGQISIPGVHRHLDIAESEKSAWLTCMQKAVDEQPFETSFKVYLMQQLEIPAEFVRSACSDRVAKAANDL